MPRFLRNNNNNNTGSKRIDPQQQVNANNPQSPSFVGAVGHPASSSTAPVSDFSSLAQGRGYGQQGASSSAFSRPQHPKGNKSSSSGWISSTSGSTVVDNSSGVTASAPGSPAEIAARHAAGAAAAAAAAAAGGLVSSTSGGTTSDGSNDGVSQHQRHQRQRRQWGRLGKVKFPKWRSTSSETPSETDRKRKAQGGAPRVGSTSVGTPGLSGGSGSMSSSRQHGFGRMVADRYEILDTLGHGYSGKVKRAIDVQRGEMVALKVMDKLDPRDPSYPRRSSRLNDEVLAMQRCGSHEHTVSLISAMFDTTYPRRNGELTNAPILVLELCEKGELFELLSQPGGFPPIVCKEYFRQLMCGVKFCHDNGVCHRDLKPENLLLDSDFTLKIADFGFAALGREHMMCRSIVGSRTYMAPEVLNLGQSYAYGDDAGYDAIKADVWSSGVILFTMLAGHPPMEKANESDWWFRALKLSRQDLFWQSHQNTAPPLPEDAKHLIQAMLTVDPAHRINVDQIMNHPYVVAAPRGPFWKGRPEDPRAVLREKMQELYEQSMASKRLCTVASSSRGTADSAGPEGSGSPSAGSGAPGRRGYVENPHDRSTWRGPGDDPFEVPTMLEEDAAKVTGGFMATGDLKNLVKAVEQALFELGAEIAGVNKENGLRTFRQTAKVSAVIPEDPKLGSGRVGVVAKVFRVVSRREVEGSAGGGGGSATTTDADCFVVVLRRKRGDYYRYRKVEELLVARLTTKDMSVKDSDVMEQSGVSMSPMP